MSRRANRQQQANPLQLVPPQLAPYQGHQSGWLQMPPPTTAPVEPQTDLTIAFVAAIAAAVFAGGGAWFIADLAYQGDRLRQLESANQALQGQAQSAVDRLAAAQGAICR
jgi:hypothetical protein